MNAVLWSLSRRIRELAALGGAARMVAMFSPTVTITRKTAEPVKVGKAKVA